MKWYDMEDTTTTSLFIKILFAFVNLKIRHEGKFDWISVDIKIQIFSTVIRQKFVNLPTS